MLKTVAAERRLKAVMVPTQLTTALPLRLTVLGLLLPVSVPAVLLVHPQANPELAEAAEAAVLQEQLTLMAAAVGTLAAAADTVRLAEAAALLLLPA